MAIFIIFVIFVVVVASVVGGSGSKVRPGSRPWYRYRSKKYIMTAAEASFFKRLERLFGEKYYIFPQIHLSSLLDHRIKGQNWRGALSTIQRKSVDYALVDRETLVTRCAVELDDGTHDARARIERDMLVEGIFYRADVPLVRVRGVNGMSDEQLIKEFVDAVSDRW